MPYCWANKLLLKKETENFVSIFSLFSPQNTFMGGKKVFLIHWQKLNISKHKYTGEHMYFSVCGCPFVTETRIYVILRVGTEIEAHKEVQDIRWIFSRINQVSKSEGSCVWLGRYHLNPRFGWQKVFTIYIADEWIDGFLIRWVKWVCLWCVTVHVG